MKKAKQPTFEIGDKVVHRVPSMMYHRAGTVVAFCKVHYKEEYWTIEHIDPKTQKIWRTHFGASFLKKVPLTHKGVQQ